MTGRGQPSGGMTVRAGVRGVVAVLVLGMLVACGSSGDDSNEGASSTGATAAGSTTASSTGATTASSTGATTTSESMADEEPVKGGTLKVGVHIEPAGLDPIQLRGVPNGQFSYIMPVIFDMLFYTDPETLELVPRIGESLASDDGGLTWTLKLRSGVEFSDGTPYDAAAVQFNWERIAAPDSTAPSAVYARQIESMEIVDPLTLQLTLVAADLNWSQQVARHLTALGSPTAIQAMGADFANKPVGAGPFVMEEWVRGSSMKLVRNPNYWQEGKPYLDGIDFALGLIDDAQRYNTLDTGGVDMILDPVSQNVAKAEESGKYDIYSTPALGGGYAIGFNTSTAPFDDVRLRRALALVLDSEEIVQRGDLGEDELMTTIDVETSPFYDPDLALPEPDVAAAQALIDEVVADQGGQPIQFTLNSFRGHVSEGISSAAQAMVTSRLKNVDMSVEVMENPEVSRRYLAGEYQSTMLSIRSYDPALDFPAILRSSSNLNYFKYSDPEVDAAIEELTGTEDMNVRKGAYKEIIQKVLEDVPFLWVTRINLYYVADKKVRGLEFFHDVRPLFESVWLAE